MTVKHQHKEYTAMLNKWQRCNDVCAGQDAVHAAGTLYLPQLQDQEAAEYEKYKDRTPFYNATWRTIAGLRGMVFRKPPKVEVPSAMEEMLKDITLSGQSLYMFALKASEECLKLGRIGIFIDFPVVAPGATAADALIQNYRPSLRMYSATSIINWKTKAIRNSTVLSMVVLKEIADKPIDEFSDEEEFQYRVLDLTTLGDMIVYRVRLFAVRIINGKEEDVLLDTIFPRINGKYLDRIPFQFVGVDNLSWCVDEPPLIDLVDTNLSHYRSNAQYEHGCYFTASPTPVITGYEPSEEGEKFYIGSTTAWIFRNPNTKAFYLEFGGQGLQELANNLTKKENQMAVLGARMLELQIRKAESANTASIHRSGEQSMLASIAQSLSQGIQKVLETFRDFAGLNGDIVYDLNRDFFPVPMDALTLTALIAGWQNGAYSYDTMFANLKKGEIVAVEATPEEEQKAIDANPPPIQDAPTTPGNASPKAPKPKETPATPAPTITQLQNTK